ncbi:hypothetical protein [Undibacterium sp. TJN19]|uniref:hypothetical protein n=1 Tax=Undibacterium sp. TJN19 TaxID=3413055 RepID=UPI003BEF6E0D
MDNLDSFYSGNIFSKEYYGVYGTFTPESSEDLEYLMTNIPVSDLQSIKTAADITEFDNVTFEEIIQRDIDYKRVDDELIAQYLESSDKGVKFFPPLLISLVPSKTDEPAAVVHQPVTTIENNKLIITFGKASFQLHLNLSNNATPHKIKVDDNVRYRIPFAAIKINPDAVKLVVIDGQHRFEALRRMASNPVQRKHIENIEVPVCIFFTRRDLSHNASTNSDLRELFVTINSKQKDVSGHFIVLLDDKKLSSHIVRTLANKWKREELIPGRCALPLLEWNTRESRSAYQRQKKYSVTTVSVIADCITKYLFSDSRKGYMHSLLQLTEIKDQLVGSKDAVGYDQLDNSTFSTEQFSLLKSRVETRIVEPLDVLLREPRPYKELIASFTKKLFDFTEQEQKGIVGINYYLNEVLYKYRRCTKGDQQAPRDAEIEFESAIKGDDLDDAIYFKLIFQQGLMRSWAEYATSLSKYKLPAKISAQSLIAGLEVLCFKKGARFCEPSNLYTQALIFEGQRIVQNETSRKAWIHLLLATLMSTNVRKEIADFIQKNVTEIELASLESTLLKLGEENADEYLELYLEAAEGDIKRNWRYRDLSREDMDQLIELEADAKKKIAFEEKISALARIKFDEASKSLYAALSTANT